ncbi:MAG: hypothetical protein KDB88_10375 [Flavobacteriales bacterium]|nr:hypothetical protein [Flavobacteriales bacterium]
MHAKPVIPFDFFDPLVEFGTGALNGTMELTGGFGFGMLVRHGISNTFSFETGISQIRRGYAWQLVNDTNGFAADDRIRYIGYEIPVTGLVFVRLGERSYMNASLGASLDMYPSDAVREVVDARAFMSRSGWAQFGLNGNLGFEYRTERSGIIYLGATYHRAFGDMAQATLTWFSPRTGLPSNISTPLAGSYLTLDLRYLFHEDPNRERVRKNK